MPWPKGKRMPPEMVAKQVAARQATATARATDRPLATCPICGAVFHPKSGAKARKTCAAAECSKELSRRCRINYRGHKSSPQAARGRARSRVTLERCARCSVAGGRLEVHHRDGDPYNNSTENLEALCLPCHRRLHPPRNHQNRLRGSGNRNSKLTEADVRDIRERREGGCSVADLANEYGVTGTLIRQVVLRNIWKHVP